MSKNVREYLLIIFLFNIHNAELVKVVFDITIIVVCYYNRNLIARKCNYIDLNSIFRK